MSEAKRMEHKDTEVTFPCFGSFGDVTFDVKVKVRLWGATNDDGKFWAERGEVLDSEVTVASMAHREAERLAHIARRDAGERQCR